VLGQGIGASILHAFVSRADRLLPGTDSVVADLGCGAGDALGRLHAGREVVGVGIDLSAAAVNIAARRFAAVTWVVANADRTLPLLDERVSLVLSLHARRNPVECHRVLSPGGHLLAAVPAADDLVELREAVQGSRVERDRVHELIVEHEPHFEVIDQFVARERHQLSGTQLRDVLRGTYRGERASDAARVQALGTLAVTFASDMIVLRRR
jgi:23S rRNA (guanine745-N1)-methyltransferase